MVTMEKDFERWNIKKQGIHFTNRGRLRFSEREIWFCALGVNIGFEQDGSGTDFLRPLIVFRKINRDQFLGIPLTSTLRFGKEYFPLIDKRGNSVAMLAQIRLFDAKRLVYFSKMISSASFEALEISFAELIKVNPCPIHRLDVCGAGEHVGLAKDLPQGQDDDPHVNNNEDGMIVK